jgi:hypothetical protein
MSGRKYQQRWYKFDSKGKIMTREEAYARCPPDSYVEFYGGRWLVVPFAPVEQPEFFVCSPESVGVFSAARGLEVAGFDGQRAA